jgi:hypothetical protein
MSVDKDNSELEFDVGTDETETDVEVAQDPEQGHGQEQAAQPASPATEHSSELDTVSDAVQKRIAKLTARMREAERREQAAVEYAKGVQSQHSTLQQRLMQSDYQRLNESKSRIDTQLIALRQIIKKAREENDIDTETEAQERLSALSMEGRQVASMLQQGNTTHQAAPQQDNRAQQVQQQQAPQQAPARPKPSARAQSWANDNSWFGQDRVMTYVAWGIHQSLVEQEGLDPESDEYYTELDRRLRTEIPHKFTQQNRQQRSAPAVAPASRASAGINTNARRQVRLKPSQVAIAKKLGVPLEEYAKYVKE